MVAVGDNSDHECKVHGWGGIAQVAAGSLYTVGLKSDGTVVAVGDNYYGQCNVSSWTGIGLASAVNSLESATIADENEAAGAARPVYPSGVVPDGNPVFTWEAVPDATKYYLLIKDGDGLESGLWISAEQAGCAGGTGVCTADPPIHLEAGACSWQVRAYSGRGYGPWSAGMDFSF